MAKRRLRAAGCSFALSFLPKWSDKEIWLMPSNSEVCVTNLWDHKLSVYKRRAVRHTILIHQTRHLRKAFKAFQYNSISLTIACERAHCHESCTEMLFRFLEKVVCLWNVARHCLLIQLLLNKTSFFIFQLHSNCPKHSIQNPRWCIFKFLIQSLVFSCRKCILPICHDSHKGSNRIYAIIARNGYFLRWYSACI